MRLTEALPGQRLVDSYGFEWRMRAYTATRYSHTARGMRSETIDACRLLTYDAECGPFRLLPEHSRRVPS